MPSELETPRRILRVRLLGHEAAVDLEAVEDGPSAEAAFVVAYRGLFGDSPPDRAREVESARVVLAETPGREFAPELPAPSPASEQLDPVQVRVARGWITVPCVERKELSVGSTARGPALIVEPFTTIWVPEGWTYQMHASGAIILRSLESIRGGSRQAE